MKALRAKLFSITAYGLLAVGLALSLFCAVEWTDHPIPTIPFKIFASLPSTLPAHPLELRARAGDEIGVEVTDIPERHARKLHVPPQAGVLIQKVRFNSSADAAGLQPADVIRCVNQTLIKSTTDYQRALKGAKKAGIMEVKVERQGTALDVHIPITQPGD